jgi:FkbM family methyltransferase
MKSPMALLTTKRKLQVARVLGRCVRGARRAAGMRNDEVIATRGGLRWQLDLTEGIDLAIYLGVFERSTVNAYTRLIRPGDIVLDIGANIGAHTLPLAKCVGRDGHVYAFEPTSAFRKLNANIALNPEIKPRITVVQALVSSRDGGELAPAIYSSWPLVKTNGLHELHQGRLQSTAGARAVSMDSYLTEAGIDRIDLVKLDVDGFECDVLEGWTSLARWRPRILMELAPYVLGEHGRTLEQLIAPLRRAGYQLFTEDGSALPMTAVELEQMIPPGAGINILAVSAPSSRVEKS